MKFHSIVFYISKNKIVYLKNPEGSWLWVTLLLHHYFTFCCYCVCGCVFYDWNPRSRSQECNVKKISFSTALSVMESPEFYDSLLLKIYLFLTVLRLFCYMWAFSSCGARTSHRSGFSCCGAQPLGHMGFGRCVCRLSYPAVHGIFPDQGLNCHIGRQILNCWTTREVIRTVWKWKTLKVKSLSRVQLFATPWTVTNQVPPFMGFSRQEYWSGVPFPSPGDLPNPGIEPRSPAL